MRRILSLVFLCCFAWAQAAVVACAMAVSGARADEHAAHAPHPAHGGHAGHAHGSPEKSDAPTRQAPDCAAVMTCGATAVPSAGAEGGRAPRIVFRISPPEPDSYDSPTLTFDPPPPRRALQG